jgi:hypothetical protein
MEDDEILLSNVCTDLVSLRECESFPLHLFSACRPGEWAVVRDVCARLAVPVVAPQPGLYATWLRDPAGHDDYAVIVFYDDESKWSMAAQYNRGRLVGGGPHTDAGVAVSTPADRALK